ncbi:putative RNA-directed DNA polymerase, eukaryota, reverse transcriptase zinc-binding domain protein [Tanacetum coccineum]
MPKGTNSAFITLIPKTPNPILIKDYRPISLIGMQYKFIAKLLANRLSTVLDKLVSPTQSAFISGRQILDGPLMVSEIIEWYRKRNKRLMIFKVDFEKAFDSVSWTYLDFILSQMGFGVLWSSWIQACLTSSRTSILVNGSPTPEFSLERGLRQGDPLSPFLFILIMEGLHLILENDRHAKRIKGAIVGNPSINLSHFFFADDVMIVSDWDTLDLQQITSSLNSFYCASGLKINISKSNLYEIGVSDEDLQSMAHVTGFQASSFPIIYLGLPIGTTNYLHSHSILPKDYLKCHIGNGTSIRFWKDIWLGDEPLCSRYNRLFRLDINENCLLSERYIEGRWIWQWLSPIASGRTEAMLQSLITELAEVSLSSSDDEWKWHIGNDGTFLVASTRTHLDHLTLPTLASSTTWIPCLPRKVNIFI